MHFPLCFANPSLQVHPMTHDIAHIVGSLSQVTGHADPHSKNSSFSLQTIWVVLEDP
jgi:hypothetical protein